MPCAMLALRLTPNVTHQLKTATQPRVRPRDLACHPLGTSMQWESALWTLTFRAYTKALELNDLDQESAADVHWYKMNVFVTWKGRKA